MDRCRRTACLVSVRERTEGLTSPRSRALNWRAQLKTAVGDLLGARNDIVRAITLDPNDAIAHALNVTLDRYDGDLDAALKAQRAANLYLPTITDGLAFDLARAGREDDMREVLVLMGDEQGEYGDLVLTLAKGDFTPRAAQRNMRLHDLDT